MPLDAPTITTTEPSMRRYGRITMACRCPPGRATTQTMALSRCVSAFLLRVCAHEERSFTRSALRETATQDVRGEDAGGQRPAEVVVERVADVSADDEDDRANPRHPHFGCQEAWARFGRADHSKAWAVTLGSPSLGGLRLSHCLPPVRVCSRSTSQWPW